MKKQNVNAIKDILSGKTPEKKITVGYTPTQKEFGDEWEQKNGYKVKKTRFDDIRVPLFCPKCEKVMKRSKDINSYYSHKTCLNCMVDYHDELRKEGKLEQYIFRKRLLNARSWLEEQKQQLSEFVDSKNYDPEFVLSDGTMEKWHYNGNISEVVDGYTNDLQKFETQLNESIKKYESEYKEKIDNRVI